MITINPALVSNAQGTFGVEWDGLMQGTSQPDPATRYALAGGFLASTETLPMWGGVGISEVIPTPPASPPLTPNPALGGPISRATNVTGSNTAKTLTGFSVFDQNYSAINSPQSPVPLIGNYGQVMFYRMGSNARIAVQIDPVLISLYGQMITDPVSWDFVAQMLIPYQAAYNQNVITNAVWSAGQLTFTTTSAHGVSVGSVIEIAGFTPAAYNGQFTTVAGTTGSTIVVDLDDDPGADTVQGYLVAGGGALPCKILRVYPSNCMVVDYNPVTGFATWNRNGAAAIIQI